MPKPKQGQINDDNFVGMLFGMKALDAKQRYDSACGPTPLGRQQGLYYYIGVKPRDTQDKAEFTKARLVLTASTYLPRRNLVPAAQRKHDAWEFPTLYHQLQSGPTSDFAEPQPPRRAGRSKECQDPRVVRQQQQ